MKPAIKRCICFILVCICVINTYRMFFLHNDPVPDLSDQITVSSAHQERNWQGDYFVYHKYNDLTTFPYVFGTRMYLYSAKDGTKHLIHRQFKPLSDLLGNVAFYGNQILDVGGVALDMPYDNLLITLNKGGDFIDLDSSYNYAITGDGIYFIKDERDAAGYLIGHGLYCYTQNTDSSKKICKVNEYDDLLFIVQDKAFISNNDTECAYVYDLKSKEKTDLAYGYIPDCVVEQDENIFWGIFYNGEVWKYETKSLDRNYVCKIDEIADDDWWAIYARYVHGYLYVSNPQGEVIKIHTEDRIRETIITQNSLPDRQNLDSRYDPVIYFCDSYIVYIVHYKAFSQLLYEQTSPINKILTFDYKGNLVRTERL